SFITYSLCLQNSLLSFQQIEGTLNHPMTTSTQQSVAAANTSVVEAPNDVEMA
ncbi:unnamed protein product, partial [Rotaria magnacalcarata]